MQALARLRRMADSFEVVEPQAAVQITSASFRFAGASTAQSCENNIFGQHAGHCAAERAVVRFARGAEAGAIASAVNEIRDNLPESVCLLSVEARRVGDELIRAICNNGEIFRVFREFALRRSAAAKYRVWTASDQYASPA